MLNFLLFFPSMSLYFYTALFEMCAFRSSYSCHLKRATPTHTRLHWDRINVVTKKYRSSLCPQDTRRPLLPPHPTMAATWCLRVLYISGFLTFWYCDLVLYWHPTIKWFSLLLYTCNFAMVTNHNVNIFWERGLSKGSCSTCWELLF